MAEVPKPGSDEAVAQGCLCPVLDNGHGQGAYGDGEAYWINGECPLHRRKEQFVHRVDAASIS